MALKLSHVSKYLRPAVQAVCLIVAAYLFVNIGEATVRNIANAAFLADPIMAISSILFYRGTWFPILISMCILIAGSYLLGRAFCGWVCPVGFLVDLFGIISRFISKIIKRKTTTRRFGLLQYGILATVILLSFISMQALSILDPFVIFRRSVYMVMNAGVPEVLLQGYTPVLDFSKNKCVFCGACEAKCPVKQKAIIVTNYGEKRRDA